MTRRQGFELTDVLVPVLIGMAGLGILIALQELGPPRLRDLANSQRFLIAFTLGLTGVIAAWAVVTLDWA
jgi:hypothetical protein